MLLLVLFIGMPLLELVTILWVHDLLALAWGSSLATLFAIFSVIGTGIGGAALARSQGMLVIHEIREATIRGQIPGTALVDGALILVGGVLLLTPGYITDVIGFACLFPFSRIFCRSYLLNWFQSQVEEGKVIFNNFSFGDDYTARHQRYGRRIVDISSAEELNSPPKSDAKI